MVGTDPAWGTFRHPDQDPLLGAAGQAVVDSDGVFKALDAAHFGQHVGVSLLAKIDHWTRHILAPGASFPWRRPWRNAQPVNCESTADQPLNALETWRSNVGSAGKRRIIRHRSVGGDARTQRRRYMAASMDSLNCSTAQSTCSSVMTAGGAISRWSPETPSTHP